MSFVFTDLILITRTYSVTQKVFFHLVLTRWNHTSSRNEAWQLVVDNPGFFYKLTCGLCNYIVRVLGRQSISSGVNGCQGEQFYKR